VLRWSWDGKVRWALGLDIDEAGSLVQSRVTGTFEAIRARGCAPFVRAARPILGIANLLW